LSWRFGRIGHLAGDEHESVGLDSMAKGGDGLWPAGDHMELHENFLVMIGLTMVEKTAAC
jgi:hypothetical protein